MTQAYATFDHDPDCITLTGSAATTSVQLARDITVHYSDGSSDTISAGAVAAIPGGATPVFDRSIAVWVIYTVPGSGTLSAIKEAQLATITGDYAPLIRIMRHSWDWYQPMQPGGAAIKSGAWSGGAYAVASRSWRGAAQYGLLDAQSWRGGASVSGVPFTLSYPQGGSIPSSGFGFFLKVPSAPSGDMTLVDLDAGIVGYMRVKLTSALHVYCEYTLPHNTATTTQSWDISTVALDTGTWHFVAVGNWTGNNGAFRYAGHVLAPGGVSLGGDVVQPAGYVNHDGTGDGHGIVLTMAAGMGHSLSSSYADFPNTAGWAMSKFYLYLAGFSIPSMPSSDRSGGTVAYMARQTTGTASQLDDTSGNAYNAAANPALTILGDGPFAS